MLEKTERFSLSQSFERADDIRHPALQVAQCREDLVMVVGFDALQDVDDRPDYMHCRTKQSSLRFAPVRDFRFACKRRLAV